MNIEEIAEQRLGFTDLRPGQKEAVEALVAGRDTLAVMPTGSGKSAIYELAAAVNGGPVVVVSPLIALQRDQVESLRETGMVPASEINSTMRAGQRADALEQLRAGELRFIFVSPEQLANEETLSAVGDAAVRLFVVDEAHCVSSWGHDFRPEYLRLASVVEVVGRPPILALTATAAPPVRDDIVAQLGMVDPVVIVRGFDRPNIHLAVERHHDPDQKRRALLERVAVTPGPGIIYVATRRQTEDLADELTEGGRRVAAYHGGLGGTDREEVYRAFMADELDVVVATTAFGMGIDKPHLPFVFHFEVSDSVDSYYQEVGRGGRDGEPAQAVLLYRAEDLALRRFFAGGSADEPAQQKLDKSRVEMMRAYAETRGCRRQFILSYFGEPFDPPCGNCDNCEAGFISPDVEIDTPFQVNRRVRHQEWGEGSVVRLEDTDKLTVLFDQVGYKVLSLVLLKENGVLRLSE